MKRIQLLMLPALLALPIMVWSGEIADTYAPGDTLTATMLNTIRDAVNDNNTASRFYGDGSAGDLTLSGTVDWTDLPPTNPLLAFRNVTIESGATLVVPSGTTIRCTGRFVNNGTIEVKPPGVIGGLSRFYGGAAVFHNTVLDIIATGRQASPGVAIEPSFPGKAGSFDRLQGGRGGKGLPRLVAANRFMSFREGGGAGSGYEYAGKGGGLLKVQCRGEIRNENGATIAALGEDGGIAVQPDSSAGAGGGGGGVVVLASQARIVNAGTIDVSGGDGYASSTIAGAGGGGGGGIVVLAAPVVANDTGTVLVTGGAAGDETATPTGPSGAGRRAGGGGGASGGDGGAGSHLDASGISTSAGDGRNGYLLVLETDPSLLM